jgi:CBS domain-containing protein
MRLLDVLRREHVVVPLATETLRGALVALVQRLVDTGAVERPEQLEKLLGEDRIRDVVHVGDRVLLPHLRTDAVQRLMVAIGVSTTPLRHGSEVGREQVVVLVLAPPEESGHYLQVVSALARALRSDEVVDRLASAASPDDVLLLPEIRDLTVQPKLTVRDVMTSRVYRVSPTSPVAEALELLRRHQLKAVPVVGEKWEVLGVVSDRDILRLLLPSIGRTPEAPSPSRNPTGADPLAAPVREIMSRSVMCVSEDQALSDVVSIMVNKDIERVPVVHEGKLTGFLTRTDVLRKLFP